MNLFADLLIKKLPTFSYRKRERFKIFIENHIELELDPTQEHGILDRLEACDGPVKDVSQMTEIFGPTVTDDRYLAMYKRWMCNYHLLEPINLKFWEWIVRNQTEKIYQYFTIADLGDQSKWVVKYLPLTREQYDVVFYSVFHSVPCEKLGRFMDNLCG